MKKIQLTQGKVALVDDEDCERVNQFRWYANFSRGQWSARHSGKKFNGKQFPMLLSRFILNAPRGVEVDHRDRNALNNQRSNLRLCTHAENQQNSKCRRTGHLKGVWQPKGTKRWAARITIKGRDCHLGMFDTAEEAAKSYDDSARKLFGEFARTNFHYEDSKEHTRSEGREN